MKIAFYNNEQVASATLERDLGLPGIVWKDSPEDFDISKVYKLEDGELIEVPIEEHSPERLRVHRVLSENLDPLTSDFTILGFRKMSPSYDRGKKVNAQYKCVTKDEVIVEKVFQDVRDEDGILTGLQITFNWHGEDNTIRLSKTEIVKSYNKYEAETEERQRRYRQFDYLRASAKGTPNEPYIQMIVEHYSSQISKYQDDGLLTLDIDMQNETNLTINTILSAPVPRNDGQGNTTVMKAMQYQIGTIDIGDL